MSKKCRLCRPSSEVLKAWALIQSSKSKRKPRSARITMSRERMPT